MAIRQFTHNMNIIAALSDEPNEDDGLTPSALKAKFDEGGSAIKSYVNGTLIPDVNTAITEEVNKAAIKSGNMPMGGTQGQLLVKNSSTDYDARFADVTDTVAPEKIKLTGSVALRLGVPDGTDVANGIGLTLDRTVQYAACSTAGATAAKTVAITGFTLTTGATVIIPFTATNTAANPTLNVNNTGAKAILFNGAAVKGNALAANVPRLLVYDGTNWQLLSAPVEVSGNFTSGAMSTASTITLGFRPQTIEIFYKNTGYERYGYMRVIINDGVSQYILNDVVSTGADNNATIYVSCDTINVTATGFQFTPRTSVTGNVLIAYRAY